MTNSLHRAGFNTDAFDSAPWDFENCLEPARQNDVHFIECGVVDGVSWFHGLRFQPHLALLELDVPIEAG